MRRVLGILRRCLKIGGGIACALSVLLLIATVVLWLRSLGHREAWRFVRFEPRPEWTTLELTGYGIRRGWSAHVIHGRLWLGSGTVAPWTEFKQETEYQRDPISADEAKREFDSSFQPGERPWSTGTERAWRFAGLGFRHWHNAVHSRIGRPTHEGFSLALPFWMLAVVCGIWPAVFLLRRLLRKKRYAAGLCPACGYDLRATPDPAGPRLPRCPECGAIAERSAAFGSACMGDRPHRPMRSGN